MGQCIYDNKQAKVTRTLPHRIVYETEDQSRPKLHFQVVLANVKLRSMPEVHISDAGLGSAVLLAALPCRNGVATCTGTALLHPQGTCGRTQWKIQHKFTLLLTLQQLKAHFVQVEARDAEGKVLAKIRINLHLIAVGPYHQDFELSYSNGQKGRVQFDLKMAQIIQVGIESAVAEIDLFKQHPGEKFYYSIKTIAGYNGAWVESQPSYLTMIELEETLPLNTSSQNHDEELKRQKTTYANTLSWKDAAECKLPEVRTEILSSELHNTFFQIFLWRIKGENQKQLFADCYVSFYKLFGTEPLEVQGETHLEKRTIKMEERVLHHGRNAGKACFIFNVTNEKYLKQHQICVRTQEGILKASPMLGIAETNDSSIDQIKQLLRFSQIVQSKVWELDRLLIMEQSKYDIRRMKIQIEKELQRLYARLDAPSLSIAYRYGSDMELLKAQKIFIEIGLKILSYLSEQDPIINDYCWLILTAFVERQEFTLAHMGYNEKHKKKLQKIGSEEQITRKHQVGLMYRLFLHKILELALKSLTLKGSQCEQTFSQVFCAYAYFSIPQFRREVLTLIPQAHDPQICEWRGIEFNLHDDIPQQPRDANTFSLLFDWETHFYHCLTPTEDDSNIDLADILAEPSWKEVFRQRDDAFFCFLKYWIKYVERSCHSCREIQWRYFPGYNRLLRGYFSELKLRSIVSYPQSLVECGLHLLSNANLLNIITTILFNKANTYEATTVVKTVQFLGKMLCYIASTRKQIPITFNYVHFFKGVKVVIDSDFSFTMYSILIMLYNHFQLFHEEFKKALCMFLLGKQFFRLFLHWSTRVCEVFYHFLLSKIEGRLSHTHPHVHRLHNLIATVKSFLSTHETNSTLLPMSSTALPLHVRMHNKISKLKHSARQDTGQIKTEIKGQVNEALEKIKREQYNAVEKRKVREESTFIVSEQRDERHRKHSEQIHRRHSDEIRMKHEGHRKHSADTNPMSNEMQKRSKEMKIDSEERLTRSAVLFNQKIKVQMNMTGFVKEKQLQQNIYSSLLFKSLLQSNEFELGQVHPHQLVYVSSRLKQYYKIHEQVTRSRQDRDSSCSIIPQHDIEIDKREIRPDEIDDW